MDAVFELASPTRLFSVVIIKAAIYPTQNYRGIMTNIVEENLRLLCSRKSERALIRVGDVAREWGNMAKHFTAHKAVVACVSGEDVARTVARMARIVARMATYDCKHNHACVYDLRLHPNFVF